VLEPPLSYTGELGLEPPGNDVDRDTTVGVVIDACYLLSCNSRIPGAWQKSSNNIQLLGPVQESLRERDGFMLIFLRVFVST
jgi:hypothetical protein